MLQTPTRRTALGNSPIYSRIIQLSSVVSPQVANKTCSAFACRLALRYSADVSVAAAAFLLSPEFLCGVRRFSSLPYSHLLTSDVTSPDQTDDVGMFAHLLQDHQLVQEVSLVLL